MGRIDFSYKCNPDLLKQKQNFPKINRNTKVIRDALDSILQEIILNHKLRNKTTIVSLLLKRIEGEYSFSKLHMRVLNKVFIESLTDKNKMPYIASIKEDKIVIKDWSRF